MARRLKARPPVMHTVTERKQQTDDKGRQQIVYTMSGGSMVNVVTLPLVRAFSQ